MFHTSSCVVLNYTEKFSDMSDGFISHELIIAKTFHFKSTQLKSYCYKLTELGYNSEGKKLLVRGREGLYRVVRC
jgi:hypothetical protein